MYNKKAQIGETITWVVATIIIIVVLVFSIFIAGIYFNKGKNLKSSSFKSKDILASKSLFSYLLTPSEEGKVYDELKNEDNLDRLNGILALNVFQELYGEGYEDVWFGFIFDRILLPAKPNDYFGRRPTGITGGDINRRSVPYFSEEIKLDENKSLELYLSKESSVK